MKSTIGILIVFVAGSVHAANGPRLRVIPQVNSALTIEIGEAPSGAPMIGAIPQQRVLDFGLLASLGAGTPAPNVTIRQTGDRIIASTDFALNVTGTSVSGSAHIVGSVVGIDPAYLIRIDGVALTSVPIIVRPPGAIGNASIHRMEVEIPTSSPATPLLLNIIFQAIPD